jgi:formate/nitrite transporter FocA (FNT family)
MNPKREKFYRALFLIAAIYDISLGIIFTFFYRIPFKILGIADKLPESGSYLSLIGAFLFVIGVAYYLIYRGDLLRNRDLVTVGALYKLGYCLIVVYYAVIGDIPHMIFVLLFGGCDLIFFILMFECRLYLQKIAKQA